MLDTRRCHLLFLHAELGGVIRDVRCRAGKVTEIGSALKPNFNETVIDARGGMLLKGLFDHHLHLFSMAAQRLSIPCGPPQIRSEIELSDRLRYADGAGWIRGVGYHESIAGELTVEQLDAWQGQRPVRIQHRSGRVWFLNSLAKRELGMSERESNQLFRKDQWLRDQLPESSDIYESIQAVSQELAGEGVTHVTDATPTNTEETRAVLKQYCEHQTLSLMGNEKLREGEFKIILDDYHLPEFEGLVQSIKNAHRANRPVAIHCVSRVEVVYAIEAIAGAGVLVGDRLEHGTILPRDAMERVAELGLTVVPNPNFIFERGDQYALDAEPRDLEVMLPIRSFVDTNIGLLGGTDAPFGRADPWQAMQSAVDRLTSDGKTMSRVEGVSPEVALALFSEQGSRGSIEDIYPKLGDPANLCLLTQPWKVVQQNLARAVVQSTISKGELVHRADSKSRTTHLNS